MKQPLLPTTTLTRLLLLLLLLCPGLLRAQAPRTILAPERVFYYPRVVRLAASGAANGRLIASFDNGNTGAIYESTDEGKTWASVGNITETTSGFNCCSGLYEVPRQLGSTPAGTLFWATSVGIDRARGIPSSLRLYRSPDQGRTWSFFSTAATGNDGLWEPEFGLDSQGRLVVYYSSEDHKAQGYNQLLAHKVSMDGGRTWGAETIDVGLADNVARPGMAIVRRLPNGSYVMSYEVCGAQNCDAYLRTSPDGVSWGDPTNFGTRIESAAGHHFTHAPTIALLDDGTPTGQLLAVGQELRNNAGNGVADLNGKVVMVNKNNGQGIWTEIAAPVEVPAARNDPCPNYTSQLLPSPDGTQLLEIALDFSNGACHAYYGTGSLTAAPNPAFAPADIPAGVYRLVSKNSGRVLDVDKCALEAGANVQQYEWLGGDCQRWALAPLGDGYYKITSQNSGQVLSIAGGTPDNLGNAEQAAWQNQDYQKWRIEQVGGLYYRLVNKKSGKVLDVDKCSTENFGNVQQYEWLGGDCQRWALEAVSPNAVPAETYRITSKNSGKVLGVAACSAEAGANVTQQDGTGAACQQWQVQATADGYYRILSGNSGKALDVAGCSRANGANVALWHSNNADCQRWGFEVVEPGYYRIISKNSGRVLDVDKCALEAGANVQQYEWLGGDCQRWQLQTTSSVLGTAARGTSPTFSAFPNPASSTLTVRETFARPAAVQLRLLDALGRTQRTRTWTVQAGLNTLTLDVRGLAAGLYTLRLTNGPQQLTQRIAIEQ